MLQRSYPRRSIRWVGTKQCYATAHRQVNRIGVGRDDIVKRILDLDCHCGCDSSTSYCIAWLLQEHQFIWRSGRDVEGVAHLCDSPIGGRQRVTDSGKLDAQIREGRYSCYRTLRMCTKQRRTTRREVNRVGVSGYDITLDVLDGS